MTEGETPEGPAYPRTTSLEFLDRCRPATAAFYRYWDAKRRDRAMPARADLDPLEMKAWLPGIVLVNVQHDPLRLTYRLVGSRSTAIRGREVTGKSVLEAYFGDNRAEVLENYRLVIEEHKPVYDWDRTPSKTGFSREAETLLLPLSADGKTVDMVVIYLEVDGI